MTAGRQEFDRSSTGVPMMTRIEVELLPTFGCHCTTSGALRRSQSCKAEIVKASGRYLPVPRMAPCPAKLASLDSGNWRHASQHMIQVHTVSLNCILNGSLSITMAKLSPDRA